MYRQASNTSGEVPQREVDHGHDRFGELERLQLVGHGCEVLVADAQRVKGLAPLACKTDKVDARVLATLSFHDLVLTIWLPTPELRR